MSKGLLKVRSIDISYDDIVWEKLERIVEWCCLPYPNHPNGCPKAGECNLYRTDLKDKLKQYDQLRMVFVEFNLEAHAENMKSKHPAWSDRQCKCLLYWQNHVDKQLHDKIHFMYANPDIYEGAEGGGVNFYRTCQNMNTPLELIRNSKIVKKIAIIGFNYTN